VFKLSGVVALAGSRVLPASGAALVVRVASSLASCGNSFAVGCCVGADAALLSAVPGIVPPSLVRCLAAFGPGGAGAGPASAVSGVSAFARSGGLVRWWAGGPASVPLGVRLAVRTRGLSLRPMPGWWCFSVLPVPVVRSWLAAAPFRGAYRCWPIQSAFPALNCR